MVETKLDTDVCIIAEFITIVNPSETKVLVLLLLISMIVPVYLQQAHKYHTKHTAYKESCKKAQNMHHYLSSFLKI